jgi:hypothetical protein
MMRYQLAPLLSPALTFPDIQRSEKIGQHQCSVTIRFTLSPAEIAEEDIYQDSSLKRKGVHSVRINSEDLIIKVLSNA